MWDLCHDESVFGTNQDTSVNANVSSQGRVQNFRERQQELNNRKKKGLSQQNHELSIENFVEVINQYYPYAWFNYVFECSERLKANMNTVTMQIIIRKLLLGI